MAAARASAWWLLAALIGAAGCPYIPEGEIRVERGSLPVGPGQRVWLGLYCDPLFGGPAPVSGPGRCGKDWAVQGVPGGGGGFGTITSCGEYTAPAVRPPEPPLIGASECPWGGECADACGAGLTIDLSAYPAP